MLKVTIEFPNGATVVLESTEADGYAEVVSATQDILAGEQPQNTHASPCCNSASGQTSSTSGNATTTHIINDRFIDFCREFAPLGDMRRVVVAAEGAQRFLGINRISPKELEVMFNAIQWPEPKSFLQTLRNAARSSFRWFERVPGKSGYYSVTERGRKEVTTPAIAPQ